MSVRVLIVDDHSMVRQGLLMYFEGDPEVQIVGAARNGEEALQLAETLTPQVILMDLLMPVMDGVEAIRTLRQRLPQTRVVALTSVVEEGGVRRAIEAGAIGYVLKDTRPEELRGAVLAAAEGRVRLPPESAGRLLRDVAISDSDPSSLPQTQRRILALLAEGCSTAEIAATLGRPADEIEAHLDEMLAALNLAGLAQAVCYAVRKGCAPPDARPYLL